MADEVKWIKLKVGMFDGESFKKIKRAKIGGESFRDKLTAVWFELMDFAGKCNHDGAFINSREIPYTDIEDIATMIDRETDELKLCMQFFINEGMVEIIDDIYLLANWAEYQNMAGLEKIREGNKKRQAKFREKKKLLALSEENNTESNVTHNVTECYSSNSYSPSISNSFKDKGESEGETKRTTPAPPSADYSKTTFSAAMIAKVDEWLQYKKERREGYKQIGLQSLVTQIQNNVNLHGEDKVMEVITASMAANYKGIVFDRLKEKKGANSHEISSGRCNGTSAPPKKYGHYV